MGTHVVIIGGISVNDPGRHDRYPYNFFDPGVARAKEYRKVGKEAHVIVFAPPYRTRAETQRVEHRTVKVAELDSCRKDRHVPPPCSRGGKVYKVKNIDHFLDVLRDSGKRNRFRLHEISRAEHLTAKLNSFNKIEKIDYFGHSDKTRIFLQYSTMGSPRVEVAWDDDDAAKIPAGKFTPTATFTSFGCHQGEVGGLAVKLRKRWRIRTVGSEGKTDYVPVVQGKLPSSNGGYFEYPKPGKTTGRGEYPDRERLPLKQL